MTKYFTLVILLVLSAQIGRAQYCVSAANLVEDQDIYNVVFGSLNNSSNCTVIAPGPGSILARYGNYTTLAPTTVNAGQVVSFSITVGDCENAGFWISKCAIFLDANQDSYLTGVGEKLFEMPTAILGVYTVTGTVTIPAGALTGTTRLRIVCVETGGAVNPCGTYGWGETEDYTINVGGSSACTAAPVGGNTLASATSVCPNSIVGFSLQFPPTASDAAFQWQLSVGGGAFTDISGATAATFSTNITAAASYRCRLTCTASGQYGFSTPAAVSFESQPPSITCPLDISVTATSGICTAIPTANQLGLPFANDNCPTGLGVSSNYSQIPLGLGVSTIIWTASDLSGNSASCAQYVTVQAQTTEICNSLDDDCDGQIDEGALQTYYADADADSYGFVSSTIFACGVAPSGYVGNNTDCDDNNAAVNSGAAEVCDDLDNDCDLTIDEGVKITFYVDNDADGFGHVGSTALACSVPSGFAASSTDCNDSNAAINTAATEVCDNIDNDCDLSTDEGVKTTFYVDNDGDGFGNTANTTLACTVPNGYVSAGTDCNDNNAAINTSVSEVCDNIDNNCNATVDEGVKLTFYGDIDGDGYGNPFVSTYACTAPSGYVALPNDCNDQAASVHEGASELCDNLDNDCDGSTDEFLAAPYTFYADADSDGYGVQSSTTQGCSSVAPANYVAQCGDCDDTNASIHPNAPEITPNTDNDCNGIVDDNCSNIAETQIATVNLTASKVLVYWPKMKDATQYNIQYRAVGAATFATINGIVANYTEISNLVSSLDYELRIRTKCTSTYTVYGPWKVFKVKQTNTTCAKPNLGTAIATSTQAVKIWWNYAPNATKYNVRYRQNGVATWSTKVTTTPNTTLTGLVVGQTYTYQVRALCPPSTTSNWTAYSSVGSFTLLQPVVACAPNLPMLGLPNSDTENQLNTLPSVSKWEINTAPNPSNGNFDITVANFDDTKATVTVADMYGKVLYRTEIIDADTTWTHHIALSNANTGLYFVRIESGSRTQIHKVLCLH